MSEPPAASRAFSERTAWARSLETPLRGFLRTETGSAAFLLAATIAALVWVNVDASSYESVWRTRLSVRIGDSGVALDLRHWVNSGLMTFFFFVVGLEARLEFDVGELRQRRRVALPVLAGLGGMAVPIGIYLAANAGRSSAHGWGAAMSTDTAFALGMLALVGPRFPDRLRAFMLTVVVVDDVVALIVIATVYSGHVAMTALLVAIGIVGAILVVRAAGVRIGLVYAVLGIATWVALFKSGVDPVVVGLVMGLLTYAYPAARADLERATDLFRLFRDQPTPELERPARAGLRGPVSPHDAQLEEAKLGVLTAALCASFLTWLVFRATAMLPRRLRIRALLGTSDAIVDLSEPVDPERDHVRGPADAPVTVVEYGDFECPYCGRAEPAVRELLREFGDVRYVWRHLPLTDVHPRAQAAAEAAEAAAEQGAFWEMHDLLLDNQDELKASDLIRHAEELGLDVERFESDLQRHAGGERIAEDVDSADLSGVSGTPTFFINERRHHGAYDIDTLSAAVRAARARAALAE